MKVLPQILVYLIIISFLASWSDILKVLQSFLLWGKALGSFFHFPAIASLLYFSLPHRGEEIGLEITIYNWVLHSLAHVREKKSFLWSLVQILVEKTINSSVNSLNGCTGGKMLKLHLCIGYTFHLCLTWDFLLSCSRLYFGDKVETRYC